VKSVTVRKFKTAIYIWKSLREASKRLKVDYGVALKRFVHLYGKGRFTPTEIFFYDLLNPRIPGELLANYMSREMQISLEEQLLLQQYACLTADKAVFYSLCLAARVPIPRLLAVFDMPVGWTPNGRALSSPAEWCQFAQSLPTDFIVKPAFGMVGKGVAAFRRVGEEFLDRDGHRLTGDDLYKFLCRTTENNLLFGQQHTYHFIRTKRSSHKAIIQERAFAHPEVAALTGSDALCTGRFFTYTDNTMTTHVLATSFRVIAGDNLTDNMDKGATGNLWCSVDCGTGRIVDAFAKAGKADRLEVVAKHPSTGRDIPGFPIPHWSRAVELALFLGKVFYPQPLINWDIGITSEGPIAIEGNLGGQLLPTPLNRPVHTLLASGGN
jgi:Sugar-transfer associated ATP-grasp